MRKWLEDNDIDFRYDYDGGYYWPKILFANGEEATLFNLRFGNYVFTVHDCANNPIGDVE